jgi:riboflavin synthase
VFTGIVEETGSILSRHSERGGALLVIETKTLSSGLKNGDSVAVNGVCLTVTHCDGKTFSCQLSIETLQRTSFGNAGAGTPVNLERPVRAGDRFGGHFVLGHVDGVGRLLSAGASGDGSNMSFQFPAELERYFVYKGSVAVDGISLTIASLEKSSFSVAVIPHTLSVTNLRDLKVGDPVNLEVDILGKYFERFFQLGLTQWRAGEGILEYIENKGF